MMDLKVVLLFCSNEATIAEKLMSPQQRQEKNNSALWQTLKSDQRATVKHPLLNCKSR